MAETKGKETYGVLPKKLGGGPHGLGDPNDKSLRRVEKDVCVMQKVREKMKKEKCLEEFTAFGNCSVEHGFFMVFNCRKESEIMKTCFEKWFRDEDFVKECTNEYLEERSEYRRTGIGKKEREHAKHMQGLS